MMRIDKLLSNLKYGTRSEIKKLIRKGIVTVNDEIVRNSGKIIDEKKDLVKFDGNIVEFKENILLMMNKPAGFLSSKEIGLHKNVYELLGEPYDRMDLKIAGRLDLDTEGLLLFTDNGNLVHDIISPNKQVYKTYYVKTNKLFDISNFDKKIEIKDGRDYLYEPLKPLVEKISDTEFYLSIMEGKFHQIKRMVEYFDNSVSYLKRISIGNIKLDPELKLGETKEVIEYDIKKDD